MPAMANVTLNSVVYAPSGSTNGSAQWMNRSGGYGASFSSLKEKFVQPTKGEVVRIVFELAVPIVSTEDSVCGCAGTLIRTSTVQISVWVPTSSTAAERTDLLARITSLVGATPFTAAVSNLDPSYG
jgi:hypothetical protein